MTKNKIQNWSLRGKHCRHPIAVMGVVDTFGPGPTILFKFIQVRLGVKILLKYSSSNSITVVVNEEKIRVVCRLYGSRFSLFHTCWTAL